MTEKPAGTVTHYLDKIGVAIINLTADLKVGDKIRFDCPAPRIPFVQKVEAMQSHHKDISEAKAGDDIGLKTENKVKEGDVVVKISG
ncbi:translation elongation factor-like protein [Candidatus Woesearchaeota archaeon]|nr:translation elongation factor-like protein [Candidatus Woesearchaeota archaeon]